MNPRDTLISNVVSLQVISGKSDPLCTRGQELELQNSLSGLQIKSQIGCSFCLRCVFICQEQLLSSSTLGLATVSHPRPAAILLPPQHGTSQRQVQDPPGTKLGGRCDWGTQWDGSPSWVLHLWPKHLARALPLGPVPDSWLFSQGKGLGILYNGPAILGGEGQRLMPRNRQLPLLEGR